MNKLPIGVFDSGLGGLTATGHLRSILPNEDIIYFGDNARIPYGTKSPEIILKFALQDTKFLLSKGVKAILIACGTVSSNCLNEVAALADIPVVGVINAAARAAAAVAKQGKNSVAVLGTNATIESGAYESALRNMGVESVINRACPMFVPLVENWHPTAEDIATNAVVSEYISPVGAQNPDAAILGCTHYPLLSEVIKKYLPNTQLISSGVCAAEELKAILTQKGLLNTAGGKTEFYTSGGSEAFVSNAKLFLKGESCNTAQHIDIEKY